VVVSTVAECGTSKGKVDEVYDFECDYSLAVLHSAVGEIGGLALSQTIRIFRHTRVKVGTSHWRFAFSAKPFSFRQLILSAPATTESTYTPLVM
jgi:hypothetical protein